MKQLLQNLRDGKTTVQEVPIPQVRKGFILVRNAISLVSAGTERMVVEFAEKNLFEKARSRPDLVRQLIDKARRDGFLTTIDAAFNRLDQPMPLGYSSAGTVIAIGDGVNGFQPGDRVACAGGGYAVHAEVITVPVNLAAHLPEEVSFDSAAFTTLGAIALHGFRLAQPQLGERVAVIGLGLLGLLAAGIARAAGCEVFGVDLSDARIALGQVMGATCVLRANAEEAAATFTHQQGFDVVLICADASSNDPVTLAGSISRLRGQVIAIGAVGLNIPRKVYFEKELFFQVSRSYGPGRYDPGYEEKGNDYPAGYIRWSEGRNLQAVVDLMASGKLNVAPLISHHYPIDKAPEAYELITGKRSEPFLGVLLTYPESLQALTHRINIETHQAKSIPSPNMPGLGVLGAGLYATATFLPVVQKTRLCKPVMIASATGLSAQHAARKFGFAMATSLEEDVMHHPDIQLLAILTRHNQHARQVVSGLTSGKAVFCEKPLALTLQELDEIQTVLQKEGSPLLTVGFNRRFAPMAKHLKAFLAGRREPLVAHFRVNAGLLPLDHWLNDPLTGGGRILGEGCHFIDFLTFLTGSAPLRATIKCLPDLNRYRRDNAMLCFEYPDGSIASIQYLANGDRSHPKEWLEVFCAGRVAVLDDFRSLTMIHNGKRQVIHSVLRQDKGHQGSWTAFVKAAQTDGLPPIPYDQLITVNRTAILIQQALNSGTSQVDLSSQ
jgi:predicted dehydrogenase/threonine dehydrogenase-like Zn-dependent dehydrogenase